MKFKIPFFKIWVHLMLKLGQNNKFAGFSIHVNSDQNYSDHYLTGTGNYRETQKRVKEVMAKNEALQQMDV
jgi:hypothetical protein